MGEQWSSDTGTSKGEVSSIVAELTRRLEALEACLGEATRSAAGMKTLLDRVGALEAVLGDLETTMVRVRQQIRSSGTSQGDTVPSPALQAVQRAEPAEAGGRPETPAMVKETPAVVEESPPMVEETPAMVEETPAMVEESPPMVEETPAMVEERPPTVEESPPTVEERPPTMEESPPTVEEGPAEAAGPAEPARRCFRLEVEADRGSLDLRAVGRSVSEKAGVVDVALLDYDGRRASLKIWVEQEAESAQVQSGLLERLKADLGVEGQGGEVSISLSEEPAA